MTDFCRCKPADSTFCGRLYSELTVLPRPLKCRAARKAADAEANAEKVKDEAEYEPEPTSKAMKMLNALKKAATRGLEQDIHAVSWLGQRAVSRGL